MNGPIYEPRGYRGCVVRYKGLDLNLLAALDVLLEETSVTRAAARLHLTQSATSSALGRLREALNDELLVLSGRRMVLTPFALELRDQVRQIVTLIDATLHSNPEFRPALSRRHFRIAASDYMQAAVVTRVQRELHRLAPGISLDLVPNRGDEIFELLERGELDLIIAPAEYCRPGNSRATLLTDDWIGLAWAGNTAVGDTLSVEQYLRMEHVALRQAEPVIALDQQALLARGLERRVCVSAPIFSLIPMLIIGTDRIGTVPARLPQIRLHAPLLKTVRLLFELPPLVETMQWHPSRDRDRALAWLRELLTQAGSDPDVWAG